MPFCFFVSFWPVVGSALAFLSSCPSSFGAIARLLSSLLALLFWPAHVFNAGLTVLLPVLAALLRQLNRVSVFWLSGWFKHVFGHGVGMNWHGLAWLCHDCFGIVLVWCWHRVAWFWRCFGFVLE